MDPETVKLIAERTAWEVVEKAREGEEDRIAAGVAKGMRQYFDDHQIRPEHWVYLRLQLKEREADWGAIKRTAINLVLAAALLFGGQAIWERVAAKILASDIRQAPPRSEPETTSGP